MIERIESPAGFLSNAVIHNDIVYVSGQVACNAENQSVPEQTKDILTTIDSILAEAKTDKNHILKAEIWLSNINDAPEFNDVWKKWLKDSPKPARFCVESNLIKKGWTVEVSVIAALKGAF